MKNIIPDGTTHIADVFFDTSKNMAIFHLKIDDDGVIYCWSLLHERWGVFEYFNKENFALCGEIQTMNIRKIK